MTVGFSTLALCAMAGCKGKTTNAKPECAVVADCQEKEATRGALCLKGDCEPCATHADCRAADQYGGLTLCNASSRCVEPSSCMDFGCAPHQECGWSQGSTVSDACIEQCEPGWSWNAGTQSCDQLPATCSTVPGDPTSILAQCDAANKICVEDVGGAHCGDCKPNYVPSGALCLAPVYCADLDCAAQHRNCAGDPLAQCTDCIGGYIADGGTCRPLVTCADLSYCAGQPGRICIESVVSPAADAFCAVQGTCSNVQIPGPNNTCLPCTYCLNGTGDGPAPGVVATEPYWETEYPTLGTAKCICKTQPGYFFEQAAGSGVYACDADDDGWVRWSAHANIVSADAVVQRNAKCVVRRIDSVILENDPGVTLTGADTQELRVYLSSTQNPINFGLLAGTTSLDLYEPDNMDTTATEVPVYGGVALTAKEVNPLTKVCVADRADMNRNLVADVQEAADPAYAWILANNPDTWLAPYAKFSYFMELYRGWFDGPAPASPDTGPVFNLGQYHVKEKRRAPAAGVDTVPLTYGGTAAYWRQCQRWIDPDYASDADDQTTLEFARFSPQPTENTLFTWSGMNHHSQFKCAQVVQNADATHNYALTAGEINAGFIWNKCTATDTTHGPVAGASTTNPSDREIGCVAEPVVTVGTVSWVARKYLNAGPPCCGASNGVCPGSTGTCIGYLGGCLNECREQTRLASGSQCPGVSTPGLACDDDEDDFGRLRCGCLPQYGGAGCSVGCPPDTLHYEPDFYVGMPQSEQGYWMCGRFVGSSGETLTGTGGGGETYTLQGKVPVTPAATMPHQTLAGSGAEIYGLKSAGCDCTVEPCPPCYTIESAP
jgi:hypothetical protein